MTTRSTRLWAHHSVGRPANEVYAVPAGFVVILKSVYSFNRGSIDSATSLHLTDSSGQVVVLVQNETQPAGGLLEWQGWLVMFAGDRVELYWTSEAVDSWGSGALLPVP